MNNSKVSSRKEECLCVIVNFLYSGCCFLFLTSFLFLWFLMCICWIRWGLYSWNGQDMVVCIQGEVKEGRAGMQNEEEKFWMRQPLFYWQKPVALGVTGCANHIDKRFCWNRQVQVILVYCVHTCAGQYLCKAECATCRLKLTFENLWFYCYGVRFFFFISAVGKIQPSLSSV